MDEIRWVSSLKLGTLARAIGLLADAYLRFRSSDIKTRAKDISVEDNDRVVDSTWDDQPR